MQSMQSSLEATSPYLPQQSCTDTLGEYQFPLRTGAAAILSDEEAGIPGTRPLTVL